jgi:hypothetical protein
VSLGDSVAVLGQPQRARRPVQVSGAAETAAGKSRPGNRALLGIAQGPGKASWPGDRDNAADAAGATGSIGKSACRWTGW